MSDKVKATDPPENCVFCGTYYFPMLKRLDHAVCHDCWQELLDSIKESPTILALRQLISKKMDDIKTKHKDEPEFLTISNEDHWCEMLEMLEELDEELEAKQSRKQG